MTFSFRSLLDSPIFERVFDVIMIFGPSLGYIPQYYEISHTKNTRAFSTLVSFILLIANILRIFFWAYEKFDVVLVIQSVVMIVAQLIVLELIVRLRTTEREERGSDGTGLSLLRIKKFWSWDSYGEYVLFLTGFVVIVGLIVTTDIKWIHYSKAGDILGVLALMIEATLGMPQFVHNWRTKTTAGLRKELVGTWFFGDVFKTIYFVFKNAPWVFVMCGAIQITVDLMIFGQFWIYRKPKAATPLRGKWRQFNDFL